MSCSDGYAFGGQPHYYSCCTSYNPCYHHPFPELDGLSAHPQVSDGICPNLDFFYPCTPDDILACSHGRITVISETHGYLSANPNGSLIGPTHLVPNSPGFLQPPIADASRRVGASLPQPQTPIDTIGYSQQEPGYIVKSQPDIYLPVGYTQGQAADPPVPNDRFICESFPNDDQEGMRDALRSIMTATWKIENCFEPHADVLLNFMDYNNVKRRWHCTFSKAGRICNKSFKKKDQAKGHIRCHIGLKPYACQNLGPCWMSESGSVPCRKRYVAAEPLQKHRARRVTCERCGTTMLKGNILRHQETACRGTSSQESSTPSSCVSTPR